MLTYVISRNTENLKWKEHWEIKPSSVLRRRGGRIRWNSQCYPDSPNPPHWGPCLSIALVWRKTQGLDTGVMCKLHAGSRTLSMSFSISFSTWNERLNQRLPPLLCHWRHATQNPNPNILNGYPGRDRRGAGNPVSFTSQASTYRIFLGCKLLQSILGKPIVGIPMGLPYLSMLGLLNSTCNPWTDTFFCQNPNTSTGYLP